MCCLKPRCFHGLKSSFACHFFVPLGQRFSCSGDTHLAIVALCRKLYEEAKRPPSFKADLLTIECFVPSPPSFNCGTSPAVHHQETSAQSPRLGGFGALLVPVTPDRWSAWISEGLRLPSAQQIPRDECRGTSGFSSAPGWTRNTKQMKIEER